VRSDLDRTLATALIVLTLIAGWSVARSTGLLTSDSKIVIFVLANLILTFDVIDLLSRLWARRIHGASGKGPSVDLCLPEISQTEIALSMAPYAIMVSVHDAADDIDRFVAAMQPFKNQMWLIDDGSRDDTLRRLRLLGWQCIDGGTNRKKPGALLHLLRLLPPEIETVLVLDPDVKLVAESGTARQVMDQVVCDFQRSGAAAMTPRIVAYRHGWLEECQALEYELCCGLGRKSLGDICTNSGVSIYRRSALLQALSRHTLSVYAEDFENSLLLLSSGERVYYDDRLIFSTEPKRTWRGLFSQRVGWAFGWGKLFMERLPLFVAVARRGPLATYQYLIYLGFNGIVMLPLKLLAIGILASSLLKGIDDLFGTHALPDTNWNQPILFALWYVKTSVVLAIACAVALPRSERLRHITILPFYGIYSMLQFIPITVGFVNVASLRLFGRRLYADHYDANPQFFRPPQTASIPGEPS
jgi:cellulose synthase/poly-beta-1,6-N-acetylglucosamine synthase-like glycosyltransferase